MDTRLKTDTSDSLKKYFAEQHYQEQQPLYLWPLGMLEAGYSMLVGLRKLGYGLHLLKTQQAPVPVISIGNMTTGGTGKTPIVRALAELFIQQRKKVLILSRGYGATEPLNYGQPTGPQHGDEAYFLQQTLSQAVVIVGKNRSANAIRACKEYQPDVILLDDGYQYLKLARDCNILLIDGEHLFGNGKILPIGPLREPVSAIRRADVILITKHIDPDNKRKVEKWVKRYGKRSAIVRELPFSTYEFRSFATGKVVGPNIFQGFPVIAFSGIAQPENFERSLQEVGLKVRTHFKFEDHHVYTSQEIMEIVSWRAPEELLITTEKDRVKVERLLPEAVRKSVYTLIVRPELTREMLPEILPSSLLTKLETLPCAVPS